MSRGVSFTTAQRKVLSQIMTDGWKRKRGRDVPARRMRFNPAATQNPIQKKTFIEGAILLALVGGAIWWLSKR